jgi:translocation and assembly module TamB
MRKGIKWTGIILSGIVLLVIIFLLLLQTAWMKDLIRGKLEAYLRSKANTELHISAINYRLPKWVELDGVFLRDKNGDTLLYGSKLRIDINMLKLVKGQYQISKVALDGVTVNISRNSKDSNFNYQFLVDAFSDTTQTNKKKSPVSISLDKIDITRSAIKWHDSYGGTFMDTKIGSFHATIDSLDIYAQKYIFHEAAITDMVFDLQLLNIPDKAPVITVKRTDAGIQAPFIKIQEVQIIRSHIGFDGQNTGFHTVNDINQMTLTSFAMVSPQQISIDQLLLRNSSLMLERKDVKSVTKKTQQKDTATGHQMYTVQQAVLFNNTIAFNDLSVKRKSNGLDANHMQLQSLSGGINHFQYSDTVLKAHIDSLSAKEKTGFILDSLRGDFTIKDTVIIAKNLFIKTPLSRISGNTIVYPQSLDEKYNGNLQNWFLFTNAVIAKKDLVLIAPVFMEKYKRQLAGVSFIYLTTDITGNSKRLGIKTISLHSDKNDINVNANGTLYNAFSSTGIQYDLFISKAIASKSFMDPFVNTNGKQTIYLPPSISITGKLKGDIKQVTTDIVITSLYGMAAFKGQVKNSTKPDNLAYNMRILAKELETGKWVNRDSTWGKLNGNILVKGSGIDYQTASIESILDLGSFRIQKHNYTGIHFNVNGIAGSYDLKGNIADSLLKLSMQLKTVLNQKYPTAIGKINIKNADPFALGLYADTLSFRTIMDIQGRDLSPENLNALVRLDSTVVFKDGKQLRVDSFIAKGSIDSAKTLLTLQSPFADAFIKGEYKYTELPGIFQYYFAKYSNKETKPVAAIDKVSLQMDANLKPDPIFTLLLPGLFFDKNIHANGSIDTKQKDSTLTFYVTAPVIVYKTDRFSNLKMNIAGINDSLKYALTLDTVKAASLQLYTTSISGGLGNKHLSANFITNDKNKKEKYSLSATATITNGNYQMQLGDKLKLNYADWAVDKKNNIIYGPQGINISQFNISKGRESISVNSSSSANNAPVDVKIDRFSLQNITGLLNRDSLEIGGMLSAQVKVEGLDKSVPLFTGTIKVDSLSYQNTMVGNLSVEGRTDNNESGAFTSKLTGNGNNVDLKGNYNQDKIDAQVMLNPIELKSIEPFTQHYLTRSSGKLSGNINITGSLQKPEWNGSIVFDSATTQLAEYGTVMKMNGQKLELTYPSIIFNQFIIKDSLDHIVTVNGSIKKETDGLMADLTAKTTDFMAINNTAITNSEIYGKAIIDADVTIIGPVATPEINGSLNLKDKSQLTYVRQQSVSSAKDREGVVEFINMDTLHKVTFKPGTLVARSVRQFDGMIHYDLNIDIDKNAKFNIIIDPLTKDELQVQGSGQLNAGVAPNGDVFATGAYNLTKGSYQLNTKFLKRKFELQEGSTITLNGDPKNAVADITAIYEIEASPYDLLANEISDNSNSALYRQKLPFQVILKIKGSIIQPRLTFDVQLKEKANGVNYDMSSTIDNKLLQMRTDASSMNKQVFTLLVMGRFIAEQSSDFFGGSSGLQTDQIVKESVSRFLSDAISHLAADLIKGVDIELNLRTVDNYSDATQRTDLNLALSKRFLDDRLSITVGKNFVVEGADPLAKRQDNSNVQFLPDITTTYKLSKDGRYMLKAYQKSDYEAVLDGYFIETGVAFTLSMDYNTLKDMLKKKKK